MSRPAPRLKAAAARRRTVRGIVCTCWLLALSGPVSATVAKYRFDNWTTDDGLPQNTVNSIRQTHDGYLWFTTYDGLVRYDGVRFTVFNKGNTAGINSNRFSMLFEDDRGDLWIGTQDGGLTRYRDKSFVTYTTDDGLLDDRVIDVREGEDGSLLILSTTGITRWKDEKFSPHTPEYVEPFAPNVDRERLAELWHVDGAGVHRFARGRLTTYTIEDGLSSLNVASLYEDQHGTVWIATTDAGLNRVKDGKISSYAVRDGLPARSVTAMACEDRKGNLWMRAPGAGGLARLRDGKFTVYSSAEGFTNDRVMALYEDREGNVWIGTERRGLYRARAQIITVHTERDGLASNNVYPVYEDRAGHVWVGTQGGGLSKFGGGNSRRYTTSDGLGSNNVTALHEDREGNLWVGGDGTVTRFKDGRFSLFFNDPSLRYQQVWAIHQDREGRLWFGTGSGLWKHEDGAFTRYTAKDGLAGDDVKIVLEDRAGDLWVGTYGGLSRLRDGMFTSYTEGDGLSSNRVRSLYEDPDGTLWIGTYDGGLNRFRDNRFTRYTTAEGLFNNGVFQILEDGRGYFWISSNRGIYRVSKKELSDFAEGKIKVVNSISYGRADGLLNIECNGGRQPAGTKTRDGKLWFPTQDGVAVVDPEDAPVNPLPPPVVIENSILDREPADFRRQVEIAPGRQNLEIHYTALTFIKPEQVSFRYKLEELDENWVEAGTRRVAYYSYLPPGRYTFRVIAANVDGVWNTEGARLQIVVIPPFYRTRLFTALSVTALGGIVLLVYRRHFLRLQRARAAQEAFSRQLIAAQESERQRIAAELHDSLGQGLLIIKNRALIGLDKSSDAKSVRRQFEEISTGASQAIEEVRTITHDLRPYQLDSLGLTMAIRSIIAKVSGSSAVRLSAEVDEIDNLFPPDAEINLYRIVQEGINNILKHAGAARAWVSIKREAHLVRIDIQDDGVGFAAGPSGGGESKKNGFGLTGIAERARMVGGTCVIQSAPGNGTKISIRIGLDKSRKGERNDERGGG